MIHKKRGVGERWSEAYCLNEGGEALKPSSWGLFKTVERFLKKTYMSWKGWIFKTQRLLAVDSFLKGTMEESIFNIKLVNGPGRRDSNTKNGANGARFNNRREGFFVINSLLLRKATTNPPGFIS